MGYYNCTMYVRSKSMMGFGSDYNFNMEKGDKKRFSAREVIEAVFMMKLVMMKILIVDLIWRYIQTVIMKKLVILISQNDFKD